jgi:ABC-type antimicrobial peptide transport system permease subunit
MIITTPKRRGRDIVSGTIMGTRSVVATRLVVLRIVDCGGAKLKEGLSSGMSEGEFN